MPYNKSPALPFSRLDLNVLARAKYARSANLTAAHTRRNLVQAASSFNQYLQLKRSRISPNSIKDFLENQKLAKSPATWNLSRQNLKSALKAQPKIRDSYPMKMLIEEIFRDIKPYTLDKTVKDYLSADQINLLVKNSTRKLGLIIRFLFVTGCRITEMISIRLKDTKIDKTVSIQLIGKGSKQRTVFIPIQLYYEIRKVFQGRYYLFETAKGRQYNRGTIWSQIKRAGRDILAKDIHPHLLRHSTANYLLLEKGKSAKYVSLYLGHSDPSITLSMYSQDQPQADITTLFA